MEINVPNILRIKPDALYKIGKYLRINGFDNVTIFYGEGIKDIFGSKIEISFVSSEIRVLREEVVKDNDIDLAFNSAKSLPSRTKAIVAIGGGKALDYCKYVAFISQIPLVSVPTIISNDGFCSPLSSLVVDGKRKTVKTVLPYGVIVDTEVLRNAPRRFLFSGMGDLFCKITSVFDWKLAYKNAGVFVNDFAAVISRNAVDTFIYYNDKNPDSTEFIGIIASSLLMNGIAMEIAGSSRPASGSEHLISHAYDRFDSKPSLHGLQVGVASYAVSFLQGDTHELLKKVIVDCGFKDFMTENKLSKTDFIKAVQYAPEIKEDFYTVLSEKDSVERLVNFVESDTLINEMIE